MADYLDTDLQSDIQQELHDFDGTRFKDPLLKVIINDGLIFLKEEIRRQGLYGTVPEEFPYTVIPFAEFSSDNKHDLPTQFMDWIRIIIDGEKEPVRMTTPDTFEREMDVDRSYVYGSHVGAPLPASANTGTDSLETKEGDAGYSGGADDTVTITILSGGTSFSWSSVSNGSGTVTTIPTVWTELANGIEYKFDAATGFTAGDVWTIAVKDTELIRIIAFTFDPEAAIYVWWVKKHTQVTTSGSPATLDGTRLPFYRYYLALKQYVMIRLRNFAEENLSQDVAIFNPVVRLITQIASGAMRDSASSAKPRSDVHKFI